MPLPRAPRPSAGGKRNSVARFFPSPGRRFRGPSFSVFFSIATPSFLFRFFFTKPELMFCQLDGSSNRRDAVLIKSLGFDDDPFDVDADVDDGYSSVQNDDAAAAAWHLASSSSDGEDSDEEFEVNPLADVDLTTGTSTRRSTTTTTNVNDYLTVMAYRLALMGKYRKKHRIRMGTWINLGLILFLSIVLLFVDCCAWKIVRLPLDPFYLSRPFFFSTGLVWLAGYFLVPLLKKWRMVQIVGRGGGLRHFREREVPTMGGIFFIPIGLGVARFVAGFSSVEVLAAAVPTLSFAVIGLLDDAATVTKNRSGGLNSWVKLASEATVGALFSFWLDRTEISSPYGMKMLVPLPEPLGLVFLGRCYLLLSSFGFVSMANGLSLTNGLDGLAGGTAALAFIGMSIAVLPICSEISIFGASMAGACVGFLLHNRYKATLLMGETGSLALGGGLAAMAACTGMFFPLVISSGIFILEGSSIVAQLWYSSTTEHPSRRGRGRGRRLFRVAPLHHHLELYGIKEPMIVAAAYCISSVLALFAGYVGLISA